jgi:hypothetical protein
MPLDSLWNLEWLNHNSQRAYPLGDEATGNDTSGSFQLPEDFIVALYIPVHAGLDVDPARFFLKSLGVFATGFGITIGYQPSAGSAVDVATALINRDGHTRNDDYSLGGVGDFNDTEGRIAIGKFDSIDEQPQGLFTFDFDESRLDVDVARPQIRGVQSITVQNGGEISQRLYGDIVLVAGINMRLTPIVVSGEDPQIVFDAIEGEGLTEECVCEDGSDAPCIRTINGIPPTAAGDFTVLGDECLEVQDIQNGIRLVDLCSQPCCGCVELERITEDLEQFGNQATTLANFIVRLEASVVSFENLVLGSVLKDQSCCD